MERLIEYWRGHEGVRFITKEEAAADFRRRRRLSAFAVTIGC